MNMPATVSTDYFQTPEISAVAANTVETSGMEAANQLILEHASAEAPLRLTASLGEGEDTLIQQAMQHFPPLYVGLALVFALALLLAAVWTLYGASLRRTRLRH
ncbi:MAG: hypothetical protein V4650_12780 [Pseudomonadota bacterium]